MITDNTSNTALVNITLPLLSDQGDHFLLTTQNEREKWKWNFSESKIFKKSAKLILIGESAAAGYFYRPSLTLGKILEREMPHLQIIDLSRVDLSFKDLPSFEALIETLDPEQVVIFSGNNTLLSRNNLNITSIVEECINWIFRLKCEVRMILPAFDSLHWHPLEIKTMDPKDYNFYSRSLEEDQNSKSDFQRLQSLKNEDCPAYNYLVNRFCHSQETLAKSMKCYLGYEDLAPGISPELKQEIKELCLRNEVETFDCESLLDQNKVNLMMDYCHFTGQGLHLIAAKICRKDVPFHQDEELEISARIKAFYHCYSFGRYTYAVSHLNDLKSLMPSKRYNVFLAELKRLIYSGQKAVFTRSFLLHGYNDSYQFEMFYPPRFFHTFLEEETRDTPDVEITPHSKINLLEKKRCYLSKRHLHFNVFQDPFLQHQCYTPVFKTHFHRLEIEKITETMDINLMLDLHPDLLGSGRVELLLNDKNLMELKSGVSNQTCIQEADLQEYNELKIEVTSSASNSLPLRTALFKIHFLRLVNSHE